MNMKRFIAACIGLCTVSVSVWANGKQETKYPSKTVSLIVPFAAGGGTDAVARAFAKSLEKQLGQTVIVVNKTGGSGAVGMTAGATSKPDGYTITMITREIVSLPLMGLAQISAGDFKLVRLVNMDPALLAVRKDSPYQTLQQLIGDAKTNPGKIKFASTAKPNFYILTLENNQQIKFNQIPFNGAAEAIPAVLGGHTDFTIANPGELAAQIEAGQMRALAVMAPERIKSLPDVPTFKELGANVVSGTWRGIAVPKETPDAVVQTLETACAAAIADPDFISFMEKTKLGIYNLDSAKFKTYIADDTKVISDIVKDMK
jgi:tripartite-type tricarboxylate transporter receptor subunit TctC